LREALAGGVNGAAGIWLPLIRWNDPAAVRQSCMHTVRLTLPAVPQCNRAAVERAGKSDRTERGSAMISLCVPFAAKERARAAGAFWNKDEKAWQCALSLLDGDKYTALLPFLPLIYRKEGPRYLIKPHMVPQTSWGKNLRTAIGKAEWDRVRKHAYAEAGNRCIVCGERGPQWPVEADEDWKYDSATGVQTLLGVIVLCPPCHSVRHWGLTMAQGDAEDAIAHMVRINAWSEKQAWKSADDAMELWQDRSRRTWHIDYSWVQRTHGIAVKSDGLARAETANHDIVREATEQRQKKAAKPQPPLNPRIAHLLDETMPEVGYRVVAEGHAVTFRAPVDAPAEPSAVAAPPETIAGKLKGWLGRMMGRVSR
jgi:hypothetical protein